MFDRGVPTLSVIGLSPQSVLSLVPVPRAVVLRRDGLGAKRFRKLRPSSMPHVAAAPFVRIVLGPAVVCQLLTHIQGCLSWSCLRAFADWPGHALVVAEAPSQVATHRAAVEGRVFVRARPLGRGRASQVRARFHSPPLPYMVSFWDRLFVGGRAARRISRGLEQFFWSWSDCRGHYLSPACPGCAVLGGVGCLSLNVRVGAVSIVPLAGAQLRMQRFGVGLSRTRAM